MDVTQGRDQSEAFRGVYVVTNDRRFRALMMIVLIAGMVASPRCSRSAHAATPKTTAPNAAAPGQAVAGTSPSRAEAERLGQLAANKRTSGDYVGCADTYAQAAEADSGQPMFRYGEARCAQLEGERLRGSAVVHPEVRRWLERAQGAYDAFIASSGEMPELQSYREEASRHYGEVQALIDALPAVNPTTPAPASASSASAEVARSETADEGLRQSTWVLVGAGAATVVAAGLGVGAWANYARRAAMEGDGSDRAEQESVELHADVLRGAAIGLGVAAVAAAGVGAWLRLGAGERATRLDGRAMDRLQRQFADAALARSAGGTWTVR